MLAHLLWAHSNGLLNDERDTVDSVFLRVRCPIHGFQENKPAVIHCGQLLRAFDLAEPNQGGLVDEITDVRHLNSAVLPFGNPAGDAHFTAVDIDGDISQTAPQLFLNPMETRKAIL